MAQVEIAWQMERRLAAILAADVVGFSGLVEKDEEKTINLLNTLLKDTLQPIISRNRGRLFKQLGDGFLVEFGSAVNASLCALEWHRRVSERTNGSIRFRIGLHLGDIIVEGEDLLGDGVNVASRLEQYAPAGGIAVSEVFKEEVSGKVELPLRNAGTQKLKNIEKRREIWVFEPATEGGPVCATPKPVTQDVRGASLAVLPFSNLTGDADQDYLAMGIADQLTTDLGHVPWFFVSAQASSFALGTGRLNAVEIGRQLGVRYIIDGGLQKAGDVLRVLVRLVDGETGQQIWSERIKGSLSDVFDLQDNLVRTVIGQVEPRMRQIEIKKSQDRHGNLTSFDFYLRALPNLRRMSKAGSEEAVVLLRGALKHNPEYAAAHGLIAWLLTLRVPQGHSIDLSEGVRHAEQALRYGSADSEALSTGGYSLSFFQWRPDIGLGYLQEAHKLNPNSARTHDFIGWLLLYSGRADEALQYFEDSLQLSPVDEFAFRPLAGRAFAKFFLERPMEAAEDARKALLSNPNFTVCHRVLAPSLFEAGDQSGAKTIVHELQRLHPTLTVSRFAGETRFVEPDYKRKLLDGLLKSGLPE